MKIKPIVTAGLLAFVVVSLTAALADVVGLRQANQPATPSTADSRGNRLITYYFHTSTRCPTCRAIEANARDALAPEVEAGQLEWRVINYEEPGNLHFVEEFKLLCPSVVLVQTFEGTPIRWKNLERVWELHDDKPAFLAYTRAELASFQEVRP